MGCGIDELLTSEQAILLPDFQPFVSVFIAFLVGQAGRLVLTDVSAELFEPTLAIVQVRHHRYSDDLLFIFYIFIFEHFVEHLGQEIVHSLVRELLWQTCEHYSVTRNLQLGHWPLHQLSATQL